MSIFNTIRTNNLDSSGSINTIQLNAGDINITGDIISSVNVNSDINISPNGIGEVVLKADPINTLAAATKQYVDNAITGLTFKRPVRIATETALSPYTSSGSGIGASLTSVANGSINDVGINGITSLILNDRVLVKSEGSTSDSHNGIYTITQIGDGSNPWILTRATDFDQTAEVTTGTYISVTEGSTYQGSTYEGSAWIVTSADPIIIDTTAIVFTQFITPSPIETMSNIGVGGVGLFKQKVVDNFELRNINSTSTHITVDIDAANDEVDLTFDQTQITGTGTLDSGSISSGFGNIDIGVSTISSGNTNVNGYTQFSDITAPAGGSTGTGRLYKKINNDGIFWKPNVSGVEVDLTTAPQYARSVVTNTESPYAILATDEIIGIDTSSGVVTVTLPQISTIGGTNNYRKYHIVDEGGNSDINNITVNTTGGDTINKSTSPMLITVDHTSITLYNDGISNWIIL